MIKQILALTAFLLCASAVNAQYDTLWIGPPESASTMLDNTPFPTGVALAARTQYLLRYQDLEQVLLPNQDVIGICFQVVDDDITAPPCLLDMHTHMKNDATTSLVDFIHTGLMETSLDQQINLTEGVLGIVFDTPWQWVGPGFNAVVEVNYERSQDAGLSPRIVLDLGLDYTATYTGRTNESIMGHEITGFYPADVETGSDNSLPAMGLLVGANTAVPSLGGKASVGLSPNPANAVITIRAPSSTRSIRITDMFGRTVLQQQWTVAMNKVDVSSLPAGCYTVNTLSTGGTITSGRFIKE